MRKLVSIQRVKKIRPIENADRIEVVTFENIGWECVSRKGEFEAGELVVYFEIDSILPDWLLKKSGLWDYDKNKGLLSKKKGNVLKTKKIRGNISQGLVLSLHLFEYKE